jgi:hypothetical protein
MNCIYEEQMESLCELGDISTILSNKSSQNRVTTSNTRDNCLTGEEDKNLSTEFISDLPEMSVIEKPLNKKCSANLYTKELTGGRKGAAT